MIKVGETLNQRSSISEIGGREDKKVAESKTGSFQAQLIRVEGETQEERIRNLAAMIFEQGDKLGKKVDIRELKVYKKMISEFLGEAVNNSHKFSKESFLDRRGRYRVYATIKKINEEVANLTTDVLSEEKDNIKILQRLDDIRGLIMDMFL